ncbi:hypothetical protein GGI12_000308 [Dipsacomyces acuminosporus]|nr:hypothetical protein GGI12_000308 [Dipsacomyces acuminosporus]
MRFKRWNNAASMLIASLCQEKAGLQAAWALLGEWHVQWTKVMKLLCPVRRHGFATGTDKHTYPFWRSKQPGRCRLHQLTLSTAAVNKLLLRLVLADEADRAAELLGFATSEIGVVASSAMFNTVLRGFLDPVPAGGQDRRHLRSLSALALTNKHSVALYSPHGLENNRQTSCSPNRLPAETHLLFRGMARWGISPDKFTLEVLLVLSYIPDYAVLVVMAVIWGLLSNIEPFHRDFSLTNKTIQYPHKPDSVPFYAAVILCFVFPLVAILLWTGLIRRSFHDMNSGVLGLCVSLVMNMMITNTIKNLAGRHRPDFITRCNLDMSTVATLEPAVGLLTTAVCRQTDKRLFRDGMRSFPSGHTSFSFAGLTYLSLWLSGHLRLADGHGRAYKPFVVLVPELTALLIGVSRTKDYRHHWQDVLGGALLGIFMGWFGYRQYYPSPMSIDEDPSMPYPPRIPEEEDGETFGIKTFTRIRPPTGTNAQALGASTIKSTNLPVGASTSILHQGYGASKPAASGSTPAYPPQQAGVRAPEEAYGMYTRNSSISELRA